MEVPNRTKKVVGTTAVAIGLLLGAAGVANAVTGPSSTAAQAVPAQAQVDPAPNDETTEAPDTEQNDANDTPEQEAAEDAAEQQLLNSFPISADEASAAALAAVPGTVEDVEISDDTASPVFEVEIIDANGQEIKVTVDPTTGAVLDQVAEGPDDNEANEGPEVNDGADENDANEANEGPEVNEGPEANEAPDATGVPAGN